MYACMHVCMYARMYVCLYVVLQRTATFFDTRSPTKSVVLVSIPQTTYFHRSEYDFCPSLFWSLFSFLQQVSCLQFLEVIFLHIFFGDVHTILIVLPRCHLRSVGLIFISIFSISFVTFILLNVLAHRRHRSIFKYSTF